MKEHELKVWPIYFQAICDGRKTYEVRFNDRDFQVGDTLHLREVNYDCEPEVYTGKEIRVEVTYIMRGPGFGLLEDWCVMAIKRL